MALPLPSLSLPLCTPDQLRSFCDGSVGWIVLAVDEGHRMKNVQSELAQNLSTLLAKTRIILTGTVRVLMPHCLHRTHQPQQAA